MELAIANQTLLVTGVTLVIMHFMAFPIVTLAIAMNKDPKMTLVKVENALVKTKQLLVTNVINVLMNIMVFQDVIPVDVQRMEALTQFAIHILEIVTVRQM